MIRLLLLVLIFTIGILSAATIDGNLFLENQTDHSGAYVKFERTVPSSLQEIVSTDAAGYYSAELEGGIYDVTFYKAGYVTAFISDQPYYSDATIEDVTIAEAGLTGALTGTLESGIYTVSGDINVPYGASLTIEPGTTLKFMDNVQFDVNGLLIAEGTENDSIVFTRNGNGVTWGGIDFNEDSDDNGVLSYSKIEYSNSCGLSVVESSPTLHHLEVSNNTCSPDNQNEGGAGIYFSSSYSEVNYCLIRNNSMSGYTGKGVGVFCYLGCPILDNLKIENNTGEAIPGAGIAFFLFDAFGNLDPYILSNSIINGNNNNYRGSGVYVESFTKVVISNTTIVGNSSNETDASCLFSNISSSLTLNNCIIANNDGHGVKPMSNSADELEIGYCTFWNNSGGNFENCPEWIGEIVTENANGNACDAYFNIIEDPQFATNSYYLTENSPCIDAGDPDSEHDPDTTIADMGAYYYDQSRPKADFYANVTTGSCPLIVDFSDISEPGCLGNEVNSWLWDFDGDSITDSEEQNPQWIYDEIGSYTVVLVVSDGAYSDTEVKLDYIVSVSSAPVVDSYNPELNDFSVCEDSTVVFSISASDSDSELAYQWLVNNEEQTDVTDIFTYCFSQVGEFNIKSIVSDEIHEVITEWDITVEPVSSNGESSIPDFTELNQNHPNPFNPETIINFNIKEAEKGVLTIYNMKGQILVKEEFNTGKHSYRWDGHGYSSGIYFYKLESASSTKIKKMMMLK